MRQVCLFLIQLFLTFILVGCEYVGAVSDALFTLYFLDLCFLKNELLRK